MSEYEVDMRSDHRALKVRLEFSIKQTRRNRLTHGKAIVWKDVDQGSLQIENERIAQGSETVEKPPNSL